MNPYAQRNFGRIQEEEDDDLYAGFDQIASTDTIHKTITASANNAMGGAQAGQAAGGFNPFAPSQQPSVRPPTTSVGVAGAAEPARPMTSVQGAGYSSAKPKWDPLNTSMNKSTMFAIKEEKKSSPEETARRMEKEVHDLLYQSTLAHSKGNSNKALEKATAAVKRERILTKHRDKYALGDQVNLELTYAVKFNMARQYHANGMHSEALTAYTHIVKNKAYSHSGRLRVNMGNIFYEQKRYSAAIKMYRMAMDQISNQSSRESRFRIMRNIGNAFVQLGQYQEAIESYEAVMSAYPNTQTGFNLLLCHHNRGNLDKMKKAFIALLAVNSTPPVESDDEEEHDDLKMAGGPEMKHHDHKSYQDDLKEELAARRAKDEAYVHKAARLIAPVIEPTDLEAGYKWVIAQLREPARGADGHESGSSQYPRLAMEMEIALGLAFLKRKDISRAIQVFKDFERKEAALVDQAATNLSFLYFLEGDLKNAEIYAEKAVRADRYNAKALVNKANFMFKNQMPEAAKELYLEAIGVEADCVEAIYNLGLVNKRLGNLKASLMAFSKLHRIVPKDPMVIYQIANLYDMMEEPTPALKWFKILHGVIPTDPTILYRIGALHLKEGDETAAYHNYSDSYNAYPVNMDIISWLGVWYVKSLLYERAIPFFERAAEIEPDEIKWKLMVASCYRRMGAVAKALKCYRKIHKQDPDNAECLRYMCNILKDMNRDQEYSEYAQLLRKAERAAQEDAMNQNRFIQDEIPRDSDIHDESMGQLNTPNASPRGMEDDGLMMMAPSASPSPTNTGEMWRQVQAKKADELNLSEKNERKPKGGILIDVGPTNGAGKKKKPKTLSHSKSPKAAEAEEKDEWGDLDLGMDDFLPGTD